MHACMHACIRFGPVPFTFQLQTKAPAIGFLCLFSSSFLLPPPPFFLPSSIVSQYSKNIFGPSSVCLSVCTHFGVSAPTVFCASVPAQLM